MKDKRQRMAMAWPYGISDPNLYAYIMNAAASLSSASYPYGLPNAAAASQLNYYASLGLQRAAAAYSPYGFPSPLRPRPELLQNPASVGSSPLIRPTVEHHVGPTTAPSTPTSLACTLHPARDPTSHPPILGQTSLLPPPHGSSPCTAASGEACSCHLYYSSLASVTSSLPTPTPITSLPPTSTPSLFQPYKTDVERA